MKSFMEWVRASQPKLRLKLQVNTIYAGNIDLLSRTIILPGCKNVFYNHCSTSITRAV
jgi:hypothetical protein